MDTNETTRIKRTGTQSAVGAVVAALITVVVALAADHGFTIPTGITDTLATEILIPIGIGLVGLVVGAVTSITTALVERLATNHPALGTLNGPATTPTYPTDGLNVNLLAALAKLAKTEAETKAKLAPGPVGFEDDSAAELDTIKTRLQTARRNNAAQAFTQHDTDMMLAMVLDESEIVGFTEAVDTDLANAIDEAKAETDEGNNQ